MDWVADCLQGDGLREGAVNRGRTSSCRLERSEQAPGAGEVGDMDRPLDSYTLISPSVYWTLGSGAQTGHGDRIVYSTHTMKVGGS